MKTKFYQAPDAVITGNVSLGRDVSILYGAVLRGDSGQISIGDRTNIQDRCILHEKTVVGSGCTIGHGAIVHGCTIGDGSLIGMGSIVLDGASIGKNCLVGAGSLVTGKVHAPDGVLLLGSPAKVIRPLSREELDDLENSANNYVKLAASSLPAQIRIG